MTESKVRRHPRRALNVVFSFAQGPSVVPPGPPPAYESVVGEGVTLNMCVRSFAIAVRPCCVVIQGVVL